MVVWWQNLPVYDSMAFLGLHWVSIFLLAPCSGSCIFDKHRIHLHIFPPLSLLLATSNSWQSTLPSFISLYALLLGYCGAIVLFLSWGPPPAHISFLSLLLSYSLFSILHLSMFLLLPFSTLLLLLLPSHPPPAPFWFFPLGSPLLLLFLLP